MERDEEFDTMPRESSVTITGFEPGSIVAGKYLVDREIGAGGTGVVVMATHLELGQKVAIKYLRSGKSARPQVLERFRREARIAASLRTEHVVRIHDVGVVESGTPYMVMELLDGEDLGAIVSRQGAIPVERAVSWTIQACATLAEAHAQGIVHRDLKPANLFLHQRASDSPIVKIVDFGISKVTRGSSASYPDMADVTGQHERFGTPYYMSPEQLVSSANVDPRSDIWAVGVVLYELLTSKLPFEGSDLRQLVAAVLAGSAIPLSSRRHDIPPELERIVMSCLSYDPTERPETIGALAKRLEPFATPDEHARKARMAETSPELSGQDFGWTPDSATMRAAAPVRSWLAVSIVGVLSIALGAALVVGVAVWRSRPADGPVAAAEVVSVSVAPSASVVILPPVVDDAGSMPAVAPHQKKPSARAIPKKVAPPRPPSDSTTDFGGRE